MNKQWEVGKTYKVKSIHWAKDYAQKFRFDLIGDSYTFTVAEILDGDVYSIEGIGLFDSGDDCWFLGDEIGEFDEVVPDDPTINIVEQWLDKYQQVASTDYHIGKIDTSDYGVFLTTDHGDILGSKQVVEFINNRYSQLKSAENESKLKELQAKKGKLMLELASVDGEIEQLQK